MKTLKPKKIKKRESKSKKKDIRNSGRNSERTLNWELLKINKTEKNQLSLPDGTLPTIQPNSPQSNNISIELRNLIQIKTPSISQLENLKKLF